MCYDDGKPRKKGGGGERSGVKMRKDHLTQ